MIRVLQNWQEIGDSILTLQRAGLPAHHTAQKNWDHCLVYEMLAETSRDAMILDLGCGEGHTLSLLHSLGFKNVHGVDYGIGWRVRGRQLAAMRRERTIKPPFYLHRGDITRTRFSDNSCDIAISISTIEHGVDLDQFLTEVHRILKPGGRLLITTDYWEDKIATNGSALAFGLPWHVFSRDEMKELLSIASTVGFKSLSNSLIPSCAQKPVRWQNADYTFIAIQLEKTK